ncbi:MAG TPA: DapH/DapD/GlmU-related protein, partial [Acidobacteriota bacterium]|nr:DapH/DapD/GlmU-related protein [Acidobacteriota bacterium]
MATQTKTQATITEGGSALQRYRRVIIGQPGWGALIYFEICCWLAIVPGALGLLLRKSLWPKLLGNCGKGVVFGANVTLRHPHRIHLGDRVVISDGCVLDARSEDAAKAIDISDDVILANNVTVSCKGGTARIGAGSGIGMQTVIHAVNGCRVELGADQIIGPGCYIAGGGNYDIDRLELAMAQQGLRESEEGVVLEGDNWLGAKVSILPGVTMGRGSVAAAGAVVTASVPSMAVCGGVPAKVIRSRGQDPHTDPPRT